MVPTGSIFEQSWRTRWRARLRLVGLGLVASLVLLVAARAHADWQTNVSMPVGTGAPRNFVEVWGPRTFSVGTPTEAVLFLDGGTSTRTVPGYSAGTYYDQSADCFLSILSTADGYRDSRGKSGGTCSGVTSASIAFSGSSFPINRARQSVAGGGAAAVSEESDIYFADAGFYSGTPTFQPRVNASAFFNGSLGVVRVGDTLYALAGTKNENAVVVWSADRKEPQALFQSTPGAGRVQAIDLFTPDNVSPHAVVGTDTGVFLQGSPDNGLAPVQTLDGGLSVNSLTLNVEPGRTSGTGFGMAVVSQPDGGSSTVMSAVPMLNGAQAGTRWVYRSLPPEFAGAPLKQVSCAGASYCVVTADRPTNNLFLYTNGAGPLISDTAVELGESDAGQFSFTATDTDGDPVLLTLGASGASGPWSLAQVDAGVDGGWQPGDPLVVRVTSGTVCESRNVGTFEVRASDGLAAHDTGKVVPVFVRHTLKPSIPPVSIPDGGLVAGRPEPWKMEVLGDVTEAGCKLTGFSWSTDAGTMGPSLEQQDGGRVAVLKAPTTLCVAGGVDFPFALTVSDDAGLSNSTEFNVHVAPWGDPNVAFDGGVLALTAGQTLRVAPDQPLHVCQTSGGFPGVETTWALTGGGPMPPDGLTFRKTDTGEVVSAFPVQAPALQVEARECLDSTRLTLTAVNQVRTAEGLFASAPTVREVDVQTNVTPLDAGMLQLSPTPFAPDSVVEVGLGASNLNCLDSRGLVADLRLEHLDGGVVAREMVDFSSGQWRVDTKTGCAGGDFRVAGSLADRAGGHTSETAVQVELPRAAAGLEALPEDTVLVARCGEGASATLMQAVPKDACQKSDITWSRVSGPELARDSLSGATVSLATRDTGLDTLVGESVVMEVTANAGPGNAASLRHVLPITAEPFVRVRRRTEAPAASDTGLVGVSLTLTNTTACAVKDVSFVERLEGLTYVEGSAQYEGQPLEASWVDGVLTVKGLSLEGGGSGRLTYVARPHLVGERRMEGEARLREVPISLHDGPGTQVPDSGCGCTSSGPGPVLLALGALVAAVRRRRR